MSLRLPSKRFWAAVLSVVVALLPGSQPARAQSVNSITTVADTAAATLLVPYFEVDLNNPASTNTIFTINNTGAVQCFSLNNQTSCNPSGATAVLTHVVIWSDLGVPVFNFNVYLTGFDVETIDMRKVLSGVLPQTASAGQDPTDTISPHGPFSQDINFASCSTAPNTLVNSIRTLPPAAMTAAQIENLVTSLTGRSSPEAGSLCAGVDHGDLVARGYVTIDTVNNCTARFPGDVGYFGAGGSGDATDQIQLTGEVYYVDPNHGVAYGGNLVHIHADPANPATSTSGRYTFYGRYDNPPWTAVDNRQPLATEFAARFLGGPPNQLGHHTPTILFHPFHPGSTSLIVWRDSKVNQGYFTCPATPGVRPLWYPLGQEGFVAFDEQEHPQLTGTFTTPFPAATQIVRIGGSELPVVFQSGWIYLDLNTAVAAAGPNPPVDPAAAQAWVEVLEQDAHHLLNVLHRAEQMDSGTAAFHFVP